MANFDKTVKVIKTKVIRLKQQDYLTKYKPIRKLVATKPDDILKIKADTHVRPHKTKTIISLWTAKTLKCASRDKFLIVFGDHTATAPTIYTCFSFQIIRMTSPALLI